MKFDELVAIVLKADTKVLKVESYLDEIFFWVSTDKGIVLSKWKTTGLLERELLLTYFQKENLFTHAEAGTVSFISASILDKKPLLQ